jgi:hypothetical protein
MRGIALIVAALMTATPASAANTICIGEPMSGRVYCGPVLRHAAEPTQAANCRSSTAS